MIQSLSVFFPAYNEEDNIKNTLIEADNFLKKQNLNYELIVINDGSKDRTASVVADLIKANKRIRLINHPKNLGYGAALKTGFKACHYPWIVLLDSDGQFAISDLQKFFNKQNEADLLVGVRIKRQDDLFRRFLAKVLWLVNWLFFGINLQDIDCGFKLFKKEILERIGELKTESAITTTEFVIRAKQLGFKLGEVSVSHRPRTKGEQTGGKFKIVFKASKEGLWLRFVLWKESILKTYHKVESFFKDNKKESLILISILILASFLRLYRIRSHLIFLGDEGRDALIVRRMLVEHKFTFLGPTASVGGFYLGPIYYYFMALPLWLSGFDPVGPAVMVALFGILTVFFLWLFLRNLNPRLALFSAFFYAIFHTPVYWSRFSWNPNPTPFFTILFIYFLSQGFNLKEKKFFFLSGCSLGVLFQLHYLTLCLVPILILTILILSHYKTWLKNFLSTILGAILTFSPFLVFEIRHNFPNFRTIIDFFVTRSGAVQGFLLKNFINAFLINSHRLIQVVFLFESWKIIRIFLLTSLFLLFYKIIKGRGRERKIMVIIFLWWFIGVLILSLYQGQVYDYYYGFLFPLPVIFLGLVGDVFLKKSFFFKSLFFLFMAWLLLINLKNQPFLGTGPRLIDQTKKITQMVIDLTNNKPFNFALMARGNSDHSYRYFLEVFGRKPVPLEEKVTDQLIVVCEEKECKPLGYSLWEIAGFGRAEIDKEEEHPVGIKVMRLIHHEDSINLIGKPAPQGM